MSKNKNGLQRNLSVFVIYAAISTILVLALASFAASPANAGQENFRPNDSGKVVDLTPGAIIAVELPENPSTGYSWIYSIDSSFAEVTEDSFIAPEDSIPGAEGTRLLKLKIIGSGELNMSYERPWEKQPIEFFKLTFRI